MPRGSSSDSEDSVLSRIVVAVPASPREAGPRDMSAASRSSVGASSPQSTPPTSLDGSTGEQNASKKASSRRISRARSSLSTLNSENEADAFSAKRKATRSKEDMHSKTSSRAVSGATLVEGGNNEAHEKLRKELDIDMHWDMADNAAQFLEDDEDGGARRRSSRRPHIGESAGGAISAATSLLGKRARDVMDAVKDKASSATTRTTRAHAPQSPPKRAKYEPTGRMFPNLPRSTIKEKEEAEIAKAKEPPKPVKAPRVQKLYQTKGLYAGQVRGFNPLVKEGTNKKKHARTPTAEAEKENSVLPLPMFGTYKRLTVNDTELFAPFKLPADVLIPLKREQNPKNWSRLNKNRFIGDAVATWDPKDYKKMGVSYCGCVGKCEDNCINREMSYECNIDICDLGEGCGNRPFAELKWRYKNKNFSRLREGEKPEANLWGEGVETIHTGSRGFGVRAMRPFKPNQIIVEYCGEIITQEEADRRMNQDYKDKKDYYLMNFHDGMIIDATRGSICRFVNHSCDPNCRVEKWIVDGEPRMALFAGENGIMTGEELTYDYNFEVFSKNSTQQCLCGAPNCRGVLGPKSKERQSKTKLLAGAVKEAFRGAKRKVEQVLGGDHGQDEPAAPKKRVKYDHKTFVNNMKKQFSRSVAPAVAPPNLNTTQLHKDQRAKRAAERAAREEAESLAKEKEEDAEDEADVEEPIKAKKSESRSSMSTSIAISDLPRPYRKKSRKSALPTSPKRTSMSPAKIVSSLKGRVKITKSVVSSTPRVRRVTSQTSLLKSSGSASSSAEPKSMRQSRISFGLGGIGFNVSPKMRRAPEDNEDADLSESKAKGPKIPKRESSLKAYTTNARPSTAKSLARNVSKVAATAKLGVQGDKAIQETIRTVSGTN